MARRKSRAKPAPKKRVEKLDTVFSCPFCGHTGSVECTIEKKLWIGIASCSVCQEIFSTKVTPLTEAIDIYCEWIDECERVNQHGQEVDGEEEEDDYAAQTQAKKRRSVKYFTALTA